MSALDASRPTTARLRRPTLEITAGAAEPERAGPRSWQAKVLVYGAVVGGALLFTLPFLWLLSTSFKPDSQIFAYPPQWIPREWRWEHYVEPWRDLPFAAYYRNSAVITGLNIVGTLASSSLVAFAFARMRFRGRGFLFLLVLSTMMLPRQVTLIPLYWMWARLDMVNTIGPLTIPAFFGDGFSIFLLRQYMMTIPIDLDDAARLDGAGWFRIYWNIVLPQAAPALGAVAIFTFTYHWNAFLDPVIYLNDPAKYTVPLGLALLNSRYVGDIQAIMAQTVLSIVPVIVVFFLAQRRYVQGVMVTGVKG